MFTISIKGDELIEKFPEVKNWIDKAKSISFSANESKNNFEIFCSYGFFVPKSHNSIEKFDEISNLTSKMLFEDRLKHEFSKLRVNLTVKIGNFVISDRLPNNIIPSEVEKIVTEITKVKMTVESDFYNNEDVKNSIPEIDKDFIDFEIVKNVVSSDYKDNVNFDVDNILDKIGKNGIDSLTEEEKEFLDKKSKDM